MNILNEAMIKAAVIDRLLRNHADGDTVLISEMVVARYARRADLAVANGHMHAFEIKSELDTLTRLDGQMEAYSAQFDKVTLVVATKFVDSVLNRYAQNVEVWEAYQQKHGVQLKLRRRGTCRPVRSARILAGFLRKTEIASFLRSEGVFVGPTHPRSELLSLLESVNVARLRRFVLSTIKIRYRPPHDAFMMRRRGATVPNDLVALQRICGVRTECVGQSPPAAHLSHATQRSERPVDSIRLRKRYGLSPEAIPEVVLLRSGKRVSRPVIE